MSLTLFGRRLANQEAEGRKIGWFEGVPAMGLDGLGSASYGPEAMLTVLAATGSAGLAAVAPITAGILLLLAILFLSYRQTIAAYPSNGGSYTVARENLGRDAGLLAAAALMVDYMLNVAVGISAGVGALTSAFPPLHAWTLPLCLAVLVVITVVNLRGTKESGLALAMPTYLFIGSLGFILLAGTWSALHGGGHPVPVMPPASVAPSGTETVSIWLLLRAFAAGCTAMTGVEAVSNGVSAFRDPAVKEARRTLTAICVVLGALLLGIAFLANAYGVMAMDQTQEGYQSVLSQLVAAVWGRGWLYYVTIGSVLAVLCLSANTSFVGFPRLCRQVASDGYLPKAFAIAGRRLVYTAGILFLAGGAGVLLTVFGGITDRLIPLFAVGAFLSFTLSQAGMAAHWRKGRGQADRVRLAVNGLGAVATGAALLIILLAKFTEGAWMTMGIIPATLLMLRAVRRYYERFDQQLLVGRARLADLRHHEPPIVLISMGRWDRIAQQAVGFAVRLSPDVTALHCMDLDGPDAKESEARLRGDWRRWVEEPARQAGLRPPRLLVEPSPYRSVLAPMLRTIERLRGLYPGRAIAVVIPTLVEARPWEILLHTHRERRLRNALLRHGGPDLAIVAVPWTLDAPKTRAVIEEEEPSAA